MEGRRAPSRSDVRGTTLAIYDASFSDFGGPQDWCELCNIPRLCNVPLHVHTEFLQQLRAPDALLQPPSLYQGLWRPEVPAAEGGRYQGLLRALGLQGQRQIRVELCAVVFGAADLGDG
jgi:hypothetical protein